MRNPSMLHVAGISGVAGSGVPVQQVFRLCFAWIRACTLLVR
jgi:hypothetical protein